MKLSWLLAGVLLGCLSASERPPAVTPAPRAWTPAIFSPNSGRYLPDFSYAGYLQGQALPPEPPATHRIAAFGAVPDDAKDDTAAFREAFALLASWPGKVVLALEKGRYQLSDALFIERSDFVLQGAGSGPGGSVLAFQKPLADLPRQPVIQELERYLVANDKKVHGLPFSPFSWTGGLIWTRLPHPAAPSAGVPALAGKRGQRQLRIAGAAPPSELVELRWFNRYGSNSPVLRELFQLDGNIAGERLADATRPLTTQLLRVARVSADTLELVEPLRLDVEPEWQAELAPASQRLVGVGLEHFRVELSGEPYGGHHLERGFNGIYLTDLRDSYVRDVEIHDADSAILSDACDHVTLARVRVTGRAGHYGIHAGDVDSLLVRDFDISAPLEHSLSFNTGARGSVFSRGRIVRPRLDQHRGRNYQNLFDAIVGVESDEKLFEHGGADYWGPTHGAFNTFWNIALAFAGTHAVTLGGVNDAGPARLVGLSANVPLVIQYPGAYQEGSGHAGISLPSLYDAQLRARLR